MQLQWPGFTDDGGLVLPLEPAAHLAPDMPMRLRVDGHVLARKHELHMTLLDRRRGSALRERLDEADIRALFEALDWSPQGTGRYALLHATKEEWDGPLLAWSLIEHLQAPALSVFRHRLAETSGLDLDCGVPHVTLYVAGDPAGIGLPDIASYRARFVRDVAAAEISRAVM